jgi:carboxylate-amine ligase
MSSDLDAGRTPLTLQPWFVRENKWRAARYGMDANIIVDRTGNQRPVADEIRDLLVTLAPVAERLGCEAELDQVNYIFEHGASYQRQLRVAAENGGSLLAVVRALTLELRHGIGS